MYCILNGEVLAVEPVEFVRRNGESGRGWKAQFRPEGSERYWVVQGDGDAPEVGAARLRLYLSAVPYKGRAFVSARCVERVAA